MNTTQVELLNSDQEIISALADFLLNLYQAASHYTYISITERRFFNFFYTIFSDKIDGHPASDANMACKLVSNNGLLLLHSALLDYYLEEDRFPPILIADDLAIHGRSMGKFLYQLEKAIITDYQERIGSALSKSVQDALHYQLVNAIDIQVFARSLNPILLEDSYAAKLKYDYKLYGDQLHRVTDFLSQTVNPSKIANTSFVLSAFYLSRKENTASAPFEAMKADCGQWKHISWISRRNRSSKKLHVYIYPHSDERGVYLISTVRFYENHTPLLTCYPLFSALKTDGTGGEGDFDSIYCSLVEALSGADNCYSSFCNILQDKNPYIQQARGQLISTFLSIADLAEFCEDYDLPLEYVFQNTDAGKLSINYGETTRPAFSRLLNSPALYHRLAEIIREGLRMNHKRLPFKAKTGKVIHVYPSVNSGKDYLLSLFGADGSIPDRLAKEQFRNLKDQLQQLADHGLEADPSSTSVRMRDLIDQMSILAAEHIQAKDVEKWNPVSKAALSDDFSDIMPEELDRCKVIDYINDKLEWSVYNLGMCSEQHAYRYFDAPFLYRADHFDDYIPSGRGEGNDFSDSCGVISFDEYMMLDKDLPVSGYGQVAAYLALLDKGRIAGKMQYVRDDSAVCATCKAGELAMFYLPQKFSVFVPALSMVEKNSLLLNLTPKHAVLQFVKAHLTYEGVCRDVKVRLLDLKIFIHEYLNILAGGGQLFAGWNFSSLTDQEDSLHAAAQEEFLNQAQAFLKR